jgi:hypothetical protein
MDVLLIMKQPGFCRVEKTFININLGVLLGTICLPLTSRQVSGFTGMDREILHKHKGSERTRFSTSRKK